MFPLTVKNLTSFSQLARSDVMLHAVHGGIFLENELPARLSRMVRSLESVPQPLLETVGWRAAIDRGRKSMLDLTRHPPPPFSTDLQQSEEPIRQFVSQFNTTLRGIAHRHQDVALLTAQAIAEVQSMNQDFDTRVLQRALDRYFLMRIGMNVLIDQYLVLFSDIAHGGGGGGGGGRASSSPPVALGPADDAGDAMELSEGGGRARTRFLHQSGSTHLGNNASGKDVFDECDVVDVVTEAATDAQDVCCFNYGTAPRYLFDVPRAPVRFTYIASHLHYVLFEVLKNAMRATVEYSQSTNVMGDGSLPPVRIAVACGSEDISIRISDLGGGIRRSLIPRLFTYSHTTARPVFLDDESIGYSPRERSLPPIAGYGYGLPLARLYARYLGGDIVLTSMEGKGTDVVLYFKSMPLEAEEMLTNPLPSGDWEENYTT